MVCDIIICGRQIICSYLSQSIELKVVQHYIGQDGQAVVREHFDCLTAKQKLPSYILENNELTELCVKAKGDEDWSRDVCLESKAPKYSIVIQVPSSNNSIIYVWCTVLTLEPNSQVQQRMIVFSPLFIMRSHLPDPIIIHLEKRSLGLNETQIIPGKGQEKTLQNIEPDLEAFQIGIYWANTNTVHKSVAIKLVHNLTSPKWKDGGNGEVVTLDEEGFVDAEIRLGAFPGHQKAGIHFLKVVWATHVYALTAKRYFHVPDSATFSVCPGGEQPAMKSSSLPCWDLMPDISPSVLDASLLEKQILLGFSPAPGADSSQAIVLTYQEHLGVTYLTLSEDPSPRVIIHNRCPVTMLIKENIKDIPKFEVYCKKIPSECSIHHELYHQVSSYPDCKTKDLLPSLLLRVELLDEVATEWSDAVDINSQGTQELCAICPADHGLLPTLEEDLFQTLTDISSQTLAVGSSTHPGGHQLPSETPQKRLWNLPPTSVMGVISQIPLPAMTRPREGYLVHQVAEKRPLPETKQAREYVAYRQIQNTETFETYFCRTIHLENMFIENTDTTNGLHFCCQEVYHLVVFLTGFGYVYVDIVYQCGTLFITVAPEGKAGPIVTNTNRHETEKEALEKIVTFKMFITQLSLAVFDDLTHHKASAELLRLTLDNVFLRMAPGAGPLPREEPVAALFEFYCIEIYCEDLQLDNQLYNKSNFHFAVLVCQGEKTEPIQCSKMQSLFISNKDLEEYKEKCFIKLSVTLSEGKSILCDINEFSFELKPARLYVEDTFVYYIKTLFDTYLPNSGLAGHSTHLSRDKQVLPIQVTQHARALVNPVKLRKLVIQPVNLLVSIHASLKLYIASDHTPLSFSVFERGPIFTTARQLVHALAMHYAAGALFRAGKRPLAGRGLLFLGDSVRKHQSEVWQGRWLPFSLCTTTLQCSERQGSLTCGTKPLSNPKSQCDGSQADFLPQHNFQTDKQKIDSLLEDNKGGPLDTVCPFLDSSDATELYL
ncbi:Vacuolar protein sorting-associated protein 13B [Saguinus oedipus]|uniref:Vacuolar protein sorting-associated protein 13B n=1 Tax=Saguinus oedipus TaxID=9490 RepID=A0ABQ9UEG8_SAGOE|nr:Vacuolar protein sorting-associated protein 13B [Saguinus oedipus]